MLKSLVIAIFIFTFLFSNNDNVYSLISNPRNISIGKIHASIDNISNTFDSPVLLNNNNNNNNIYLSVDRYTNLYSVYYLSYCIYVKNQSNLLLGMVRREINDNFNTNSAWEDDGYPDLEDIDYTQIYNFTDKETGLLIAYNRLIDDNFIMGINFKPIFHRIDNVSGIGFSLDVRYVIKMEKSQISFGVNDLLAFKKWDTNLLEKYDLNGYFGTSINISNKNILFYEYNINDGYRLGIEYKLNALLSLRTGYNKNNNFSYGFGIYLKNINLDYGYVNNSSQIFGSRYSIGFSMNFDD